MDTQVEGENHDEQGNLHEQRAAASSCHRHSGEIQGMERKGSGRALPAHPVESEDERVSEGNSHFVRYKKALDRPCEPAHLCDHGDARQPCGHSKRVENAGTFVHTHDPALRAGA